MVPGSVPASRNTAGSSPMSLDSQRVMRRRAVLVAQKRCGTCAQPHTTGKQLCPGCSVKNNRGASQRRAYRIANGLCAICGAPAILDCRTCSVCYEKQRLAHAQEGTAREEAIEYYGGVCACCQEPNPVFLTFDHIGGGGSQHRKTDREYRLRPAQWLRARGYPKDFQVLCMNCNWATRNGAICPHNAEGLSADARNDPPSPLWETPQRPPPL